ncbi:MAG: transcriptional regulator [Gemmatimonadetes bacterium]|nr:transcriptional regulator [Gemmatimonadota bacterium]MCC7133005.1 transcriptional regulator [Gemmatimonadales bacterium]
MAAKRSHARVERIGDEPAEPRLAAVPGKASVTASLELDRVIHERVRLAIVSALAVNDVLTFNDLKQLLGATDGNLSVHARKLEDAGYLSCRKGFEGRVPRTEYRLTAAGRHALERYLNHMEGLIRTTRKG